MIEKIDGLGQIRATQAIKRATRSEAGSGASFAKHIDEDSETSATFPVATASAVSGILGVQEVDDALSHPSKGKKRAKDILDKLDDLRIQLLSGGLSLEKIQQLSQLVSTRRAQVKDPQLSALLDEIDLRAQVELAKYMQ